MAIAAGLLLIALAIFFGPLRQRAAQPAARRFTRFQRITNDGILCGWPTFSPDGQLIAYARRNASAWELYLRDLSTAAVTELTPGSTEDNLQPAWSPDGRQIAFRSERDGGGIFLLDAHTRAVQQLLSRGYMPSWSPDSQYLVFATGTFGDPVETGGAASSLAVADVNGGKVRALTTGKGPFSAMQPAWSPHGDRIAYWDTNSNGDRDIWTIAADGQSDPVAVTQDAWTDWSPAWSPDGKYLYFSSDRGGSMNLWRMRVDEESGAPKGQPEPVTTPSSYTGWMSFAHSG
jgi:TolB protein